MTFTQDDSRRLKDGAASSYAHGVSEKKTSFGLTLSNRALVTWGTPPKELIDMAVETENTLDLVPKSG